MAEDRSLISSCLVKHNTAVLFSCVGPEDSLSAELQLGSSEQHRLLMNPSTAPPLPLLLILNYSITTIFLVFKCEESETKVV